jgi:alkaline phosphatase D
MALRMVVCVVALLGPLHAADNPPRAYLELGPLLGHVGPDEARIWGCASGPARLAVRVGKTPDLSDGQTVDGPPLDQESAFMGSVRVADLTPASRYYYCLLLEGEPVQTQPYPSFTTAPPPAWRGRTRVAFGSCVGYQAFDSAGTWGECATRTNFDLLLMLGDNTYANSTEPPVVNRFYAAQRHIAAYREIATRVPQYSIWDNHDYAPEPCDRTAPNKERALALFKNHWPNPGAGQADDPGTYYRFSRGGIDYFMLDDRFHRAPDKAAEEEKTLLGPAQLAWLKRGLRESKAPVKILACGCEWQSNGIKNSWKTFSREREELFQFIEDNGITGLILLSGDRHFTAAYQVKGRFIEVTAGPFGSSNAQSKPTPEMFYYGGRGKFYCIFDIDTAAEAPAVTLEVYRTGDGLVYRRPFTAEEFLGRKRIDPLPAEPPEGRAGKAKPAP